MSLSCVFVEEGRARGGGDEGEGSMLGEKGSAVTKRSSKQRARQDCQGMISSPCLLGTWTGAFLLLCFTLVVPFLHKPELRLGSVVWVSSRWPGSWARVRCPPARLPDHERISTGRERAVRPVI